MEFIPDQHVPTEHIKGNLFKSVVEPEHLNLRCARCNAFLGSYLPMDAEDE